MSAQAVILPKWLSHGGIIFAKGQPDHLYSPVAYFDTHSLCTLIFELTGNFLVK